MSNTCAQTLAALQKLLLWMEREIDVPPDVDIEVDEGGGGQPMYHVTIWGHGFLRHGRRYRMADVWRPSISNAIQRAVSDAEKVIQEKFLSHGG